MTGTAEALATSLSLPASAKCHDPTGQAVRHTTF
jgi:hypothetical protein